MKEEQIIEEIFFKYLMQYKFDEKELDYSLMDGHTVSLQKLSEIGNSGISVFDLYQRKVIFYSYNFGKLLGYNISDYEKIGQEFFAKKIHPEDKIKLSHHGVSVLKAFDKFSSDEKLKYKLINEYRMLNIQNKYVRLIEQYQILELDKSGQIWLMISFVDLSPDQEEYDGIKSQFLNFMDGTIIPIIDSPKLPFELTKRETEILKLVKGGLLSKEISSKLSISLHTVNTHRQRFLDKLGANNSFEAVMFASKLGILD